jgi:4-hydroxy 2-oxovalerate aldolase
MKNIDILDCTLRDGGRVIDCAFPDLHIRNISSKLAIAGIDIVEVGFLRDDKNVSYRGNSTFFTRVEEICPLLEKKQKKTLYVAFIDYGMFDFSTLAYCDGTSIDGIRIGFTKKDWEKNYDDLLRCLITIKEKGYKLFIQGVNSLNYTDIELLKIVEFINDLEPCSFGIVDTYGSMYPDDVQRIYNLVDHNLKEDIAIDFHSHNNLQLSFSLALEVIKLSRGVRRIILDSTLNGMGKGAGNLSTELLVDYLVRKMHYNYNFDGILDIIDDYIRTYKTYADWGYSIPFMLAGIYKSHPNNINYLIERYKLETKDIKYIISMIDPELRQRYDYNNIQNIYIQYNHTKIDDSDALFSIKSQLDKKTILLFFPGKSIIKYQKTIDDFIRRESPVIVSVNFVYRSFPNINTFAFWGSSKRYKQFEEDRGNIQSIVVSSIESDCDTDLLVNYESLIERESDDFDNAGIMLFNLLKKLKIEKFYIAGFDGFSMLSEGNFIDDIMFNNGRFKDTFEKTNDNILKMLKKYVRGLDRPTDIRFLTPSFYKTIFERQEDF